MTIEPYPDWLRPPAEGYTAEDLDRLPDLPPHTELLDGSLIFVSPQTLFHMSTLKRLERALDDAVPAGWRVWREITVRLNVRNRPEPDLLVVDERVHSDSRRTSCEPEDVLLVIEVVSEEPRERDRQVKPRKYAAAGIPHFWRVEGDEEGRPVVHTYELDPATQSYGLIGIHHKQLKLERPFPVDIDLT
ncbi:Uma2 family endonuclease [Kitasatospora sp. RG8]|uniref:Uma2 family endonuclease n=1 Tax=Kitasatospora sp. RG8 TaxID=2820815 RepID=UPI001AE0CD17|nr:Uma2 family endonuclease [Kitasatospora sp. RG8]MBP0449756.1 Uma2 family endonuclease [Kitasatospora sp. RG8]